MLPSAPKSFQRSGKRVQKRNVLTYVVETRDGACMYSLFGDRVKTMCFGGLDPHHIIPRSQNGKDEAKNLITLCRGHHDLAERNIISQEELRSILKYVYGYHYE